MQIIVSRAVVAATLSLKGDYELALQGNDSARAHSEGLLPTVDKANWNVTPLQGDEYCIVVDDEIVFTLIDFYAGCVRLLAPVVKAFSGFGDLLLKTQDRLDELFRA